MADLCVVLDCDGVLLDSNSMKTEGFAAVLSAYPAPVVERFLAFQRTAFGMSRYHLVGAFFTDYLMRAPADGEADEILSAFGRYCTENYPRQPFTDGAQDALTRLAAHGVPMFVVSGSDQQELRGVLEARGLARFFTDILGSPTSKADNLEKVLAACPAKRHVFVGDAQADYLAARKHDCDFYYLSTWAADREGMARLKSEHRFAEITRLPQLLDHLANALSPRLS
ncbi:MULTISPECIES: HAD family hydrolase [Methylosinus]|uniref:phosphoglycolate phosphatase n=1 Tax=Methylosinus trichosporium (strain ATCC 35070 / NCIMB 11131 / UNIQEM 75 / OB3b) TaxID=595536 RepID=A0A2D2CZE3_METT3|nr:MULTISPECIES: HAD family hydrolase [Methylosinus]ATQ68128.1 HAD family hydrolase [Methylosinus trichosporium OB3b]OBS53516.1 hypothetical protein A8B73_05525 [Methylosinus sp. 3S-1]